MEEVIFPWVEAGGFTDNWLEGLGFAGLGILGALVTVYLFLGDFLPSMGGKADYEALKLDIDDLHQRRNKVIVLRERFTRGEIELDPGHVEAAERLTDDLTAAIAGKEAERTKQRRTLLAVGLPIYVLLGGAFAVLFAGNLLQAILVGFGWTAIADRIGLRRETQTKNERREAVVRQLQTEAKEAGAAQEELGRTRMRMQQLRDLNRELTILVKQPPRGHDG